MPPPRGISTIRVPVRGRRASAPRTWYEGPLPPDFGRSGGDLELQDAYIGKVLGNGWTVLAGQVKVPMTREFQVDSMHQLAVERSMVDLEYGARRTQGVALAYGNDQMRLTCAYADGHPASGGAPWLVALVALGVAAARRRRRPLA